MIFLLGVNAAIVTYLHICFACLSLPHCRSSNSTIYEFRVICEQYDVSVTRATRAAFFIEQWNLDTTISKERLKVALIYFTPLEIPRVMRRYIHYKRNESYPQKVKVRLGLNIIINLKYWVWYKLIKWKWSYWEELRLFCFWCLASFPSEVKAGKLILLKILAKSSMREWHQQEAESDSLKRSISR